MHQSNYNGGLGVMNVFYKAQSILISTFLKQFLNSLENESIIKYYCAIRLNPIFNIRDLPLNVSYVCPKYLEDLVQLTRKIIHIPKFPNIKSPTIYSTFLPEVQASGNQVRTTNWKRSWKLMNFANMDIHERETMFKFLHNILTTKKQLYQIKHADSPLCEKCHVNEDIKHMFSECNKVNIVRDYFEVLLKDVCGIECRDINKIRYCDIKE